MEIGPIFRSLVRNRTRFWLVSLEVALALAVIANCVVIIAERRELMDRPTGMDVEHLIVVHSDAFSPDFADATYREASWRRDLDTLRALPGVRHAAGIHAVPLSGGGSATSRRAAGTERDTVGAPYFFASEGILDTLGVELVAGRPFEPGDFPAGETDGDDGPPRNVILTRELADALFPDGDALGQRIESQHGDTVNTVVGVIERMHCSWPQSSMAEHAMLYPAYLPDERRHRYLVRAEPGATDELYTSLEETLLAVDPGRIVRIELMSDIKQEEYGSLSAMNDILGLLIVLLVAVTSLGIIGLTSFSVTQRTRQIGTRRALGATRAGILRFFLVENALVTGAGLVLGLVLTYGLNWALATYADAPRLEWTLVAGGMLGLWLAGLVATLLAALKSLRIQPVVATRTV